MVTCELLRVCCWWMRSQHNTKHMQITRMRGKLVKNTALGAFRKRSVGRERKMTFCIGEEATS